MNGSTMKIAGEDALRQNIAETKRYIEEHSGVQSFNGRSGSVLPMAGDYSAEQVDYDSNQTVKQKIDALVTKEASDIAGQQSLVKDTVGWTGKNLLKNTATTQTVNGITFTVNADKSVTANGTATANITTYFINTAISLKAGKYLISGTPNSIFSVDNTGVRISNSDFSINIFGDEYGTLFTLNNDTSGLRVEIRIASGTTVSNLTFYPMLRHADITDPTYEPYHESVEVMYEEEIHGVNLLKPTASSQTVAGITYTVNLDGSISISGTATGVANFEFCPDFRLTSGDYIISSEYSGTTDGNAPLLTNTLYNADGTTKAGDYAPITANGKKELKFSISGSDYLSRLRYFVANGKVVNCVVKPMLRKADIDDSTYRPYNPQAIQNQLNAQGVLGAKNLLPYPYAETTSTENGITFTVNSDGSVTVNGTATAEALFTLHRYLTDIKLSGNLILNGCPTGGTNTTYQIYLQRRNAENTGWDNPIYRDFGDGVNVTIEDGRLFDVNILIRNGATLNNLVFKPMLRLASDPDDTYQPYAMTNRELTEMVFEKRTLTNSDNLNNITETGIYGITTVPANFPEATSGYCTLIVQKTAASDIRQIIIRSVNAAAYIYTRSYGGNPLAWTPWYKFTGTVVS